MAAWSLMPAPGKALEAKMAFAKMGLYTSALESLEKETDELKVLHSHFTSQNRILQRLYDFHERIPYISILQCEISEN